MGQEAVLCSGEKWGHSPRTDMIGKERKRNADRRERVVMRPPPRSVEAGSQDSTKGIINNTHESEWPQVKHFSFFQPFHFEQPLLQVGLPVTQRASVGSSPLPLFLCRAEHLVSPPSKSDRAHHPSSRGAAAHLQTEDSRREAHGIPGCIHLKGRRNLSLGFFTRHAGRTP